MKKSLSIALKFGAKGIRIECSGRLGGAELSFGLGEIITAAGQILGQFRQEPERSQPTVDVTPVPTATGNDPAHQKIVLDKIEAINA